MTRVITHLDQFIELAKSVHLPARDSYIIRERLIVEMESHSKLITPKDTPAVPKGVPMAVVVAIAALGVGGVVFTADASVPGTLLYPMKISVNEKVQAMLLTRNATEKVSFAASLIHRRLSEGEKLAEDGVLTSDVAVRLNRDVQEILAGIKPSLREIESKGDARVALQAHDAIDTVIRAHGHILGTLARAGKISTESANAIGATSAVQAVGFKK
ncbi:MAG: hypothetical protein Q7S47_00815 [bacterium]|nr:hypothetical protein [bacterium]